MEVLSQSWCLDLSLRRQLVSMACENQGNGIACFSSPPKMHRHILKALTSLRLHMLFALTASHAQ
jgi:hypothetical protein